LGAVTSEQDTGQCQGIMWTCRELLALWSLPTALAAKEKAIKQVYRIFFESCLNFFNSNWK